MVIDAAGVAAATVLVGLAALHVYWAFGGGRGRDAVVPTVDGRPLLSPSRTATLIVAALLAASAALLVGAVVGWPPRVLYRIGCGGVGAALLARAVGDRRTVGFFKHNRESRFARRDTVLYSPLCLALGVTAAAVAAAG